MQYASVPTYCSPVDGVSQKSGPLPLGTYLNKTLSPIAAGDQRVLSVTTAFGRVIGTFTAGFGQG